MSVLGGYGLNVRFVQIRPGETNCWVYLCSYSGLGKKSGGLQASKAVAGEYDCHIWMIGSVKSAGPANYVGKST